MRIELEMTIRFGAGGNSLSHLGGGWARAEQDFVWAIGDESHLILPSAKPGVDYILSLDVIPFIHGPALATQRLSVSVNDDILGTALLSRPTRLAYHLPARSLARADKLLVTLTHPDAARPVSLGVSGDTRDLAVAVSALTLYRSVPPDAAAPRSLPAGLMLDARERRPNGSPANDLADWVRDRTGLTLAELVIEFESLGENCEFGLAQRRADAEPLGLLRFASIFQRNLIDGLEQRFDGLGAAEDVDPRLEGEGRREFMIYERKYGLVYHTFVFEGDRDLWLLREQETARLTFLRRKLMEDLEGGEKIFVYKRNTPVSVEEVLPIVVAVNQYGRNTLLWVVPAEPGRASGTVEVAGPGLLKGYIDRFAPDENALDLSFEGWMELCANAFVLARLRKGMGPG